MNNLLLNNKNELNTTLGNGTITVERKSNVVDISDYRKNFEEKDYVPEGYTTGRIWRKDRSIRNNIKRFFITLCRDNIYPYLYNGEDSHYDLIKDRRDI